MYKRNILPQIDAALHDTPVVFINGARQTGKTTLVRNIIAGRRDAVYLTLDDAATLSAASHDPVGFVGNLSGMTVIDEVQKAPGLFPAIKLTVDRDRRPGRFLLTGSANVLLLPRLAESLAGRMQIITLWPLSQGEISDRVETFVDSLFAPLPFKTGPVESVGPDYAQRILRGGFPEAVERAEPRRRREWFGSYLTAVLQRDVRDLAHIEGLSDMPRLLALLASRAGGLLNMADLARSIDAPHSTLRRYLALLQTTFLVHPVRAWNVNLGKRLVKSPKMYIADTGLMCHLNGVEKASGLRAPMLCGPAHETLVLAEILKQMTWADQSLLLWHYRTAAGREVDFVLEHPDGRLAGIEVKASAGIRSDDFSALRELSVLMGDRFACGVALHTGENIIPFGNRLWAVPIQAIWSAQARGFLER